MCLRYCYSYLRDKYISTLQELLTDAGVDYSQQLPNSAAEATGNNTCPIIETSNSGSEKACGQPAKPQQGGVCDKHYNEYLSTLIKKNKIDPVVKFSVDECLAELHRRDVAFDENSELEVLKNLVITKIPLEYF